MLYSYGLRTCCMLAVVERLFFSRGVYPRASHMSETLRGVLTESSWN